MNIASAIRSLRNGQAIKPSTWRGYVKREDVAASTYPAYNPDKTDKYSAGASVLYNGSRYICPDDVNPDPEISKIGSFDPSKWTRVEFDHDLTFIDATDDDATPNPACTYRGTVSLSGVTYSISSSTPSPIGMPEAELFSAFLSDTWEIGNTADYEMQRYGGGRRW